MKPLLGSIALLLSAGGIAFLLLRFGGHEQSAAFYVCLECGRREWREYDRHELLSSRLADDGSVFVGKPRPVTRGNDSGVFLWDVDGHVSLSIREINFHTITGLPLLP